MFPRSPRAEEVNKEIDRNMEVILCYFTAAAGDTNEPPSLDGLQTRLFPNHHNISTHTEKHSVISMFNRFIREHSNGGRPLSDWTVKNYQTSRESWKAFERHCGRRYLINHFQAATPYETQKAKRIVESYQRFLIEIGPNKVPLADNTTRKRLKDLSAVFRWCESVLDMQLLRQVTMGGQIVSKYSVTLTKDEVVRLATLELRPNSKLDHIRNMMVLACSTGLRHSEWTRIRPELWREPSQLIASQKTGKTCLIVHREVVRNILRKYEETGIPSSLNNNQKVNTQIKEVAQLAGLTRLVNKTITRDGVDHHEAVPLYSIVSTHTLRRTKITLDLNEGRSLRDICLETGQDEGTARAHYDRPNLDEHVRNLGILPITDVPRSSVHG
jgi:integrase